MWTDHEGFCTLKYVDFTVHSFKHDMIRTAAWQKLSSMHVTAKCSRWTKALFYFADNQQSIGIQTLSCIVFLTISISKMVSLYDFNVTIPHYSQKNDMHSQLKPGWVSAEAHLNCGALILQHPEKKLDHVNVAHKSCIGTETLAPGIMTLECTICQLKSCWKRQNYEDTDVSQSKNKSQKW